MSALRAEVEGLKPKGPTRGDTKAEEKKKQRGDGGRRKFSAVLATKLIPATRSPS